MYASFRTCKNCTKLKRRVFHVNIGTLFTCFHSTYCMYTSLKSRKNCTKLKRRVFHLNIGTLFTCFHSTYCIYASFRTCKNCTKLKRRVFLFKHRHIFHVFSLNILHVCLAQITQKLRKTKEKSILCDTFYILYDDGNDLPDRGFFSTYTVFELTL